MQKNLSFDREKDEMGIIWDIKVELSKKNKNEIIKMIKHEVMWENENWKWLNTDDDEMQVDDNDGDAKRYLIGNEKYYDIVHQTMLDRCKGQKLTDAQR